MNAFVAAGHMSKFGYEERLLQIPILNIKASTSPQELPASSVSNETYFRENTGNNYEGGVHTTVHKLIVM